jgi:hypothetical protein
MAMMRLLIICSVLMLTALVVGCDDKKDSDGEADVGGLGDVAEAPPTPPSGGDADPDAAQDDERSARMAASSAGGGVVNQEPPLAVDTFIDAADLDSFLDKTAEPKPLVGADPSPDYNAVRYQPEGKELFGIGLQMWKLDDRGAAKARLEQMRDQYLNVSGAPKTLSSPIDGAFRSQRGDITTVVFALPLPESDAAYVVALSCSDQVCEPEETFGELAELLERGVQKQQ